MKLTANSHLRIRLTLASASFLFACCSGPQSALDPAGSQSRSLDSLWWIFFAVCAFVYIAVMAILITALFRTPKVTAKTGPDTAPNESRERRSGNIVKAAVALTVVTLFILMFVSFRTGRAMHTLSQAAEPLSITVKGQQWWWEVHYNDAIPSKNVTTANEIHIPVGRPVKIDLRSNDVIHSFWVPNLHGKTDLIPNHPTTVYIQADKPGIYWGQCAEFCGYQHAKMRLMVVVESPDDFDAWIAAQQAPAALPSTDSQRHGQQIFLTSVCTQCHTVQGTPASASVGPNLSHIGSKPYIASGSLQNTREHLMSWVTDPQKIKPGIKMPMNAYSDDDLNALVDYLQSLK